MSFIPLPRVGERFTHFQGGLYEVYKVNPSLTYAIWFRPVIIEGQPHPKQANPGTTSACKLDNWPIVSGKVPAPKE